MQLKMEQTGNGKSSSKQAAPVTTTTTTTTSVAASMATSATSTTSNGSSPAGLHQNGRFRSSKSSSTTASSSSSTPTNVWQHQQFRFMNNLPLRILVLKDLVGAIIGRGGNTIKQITQDTNARVDVHRKESSTANENVIVIYGNPESCSQACRRILEVMQQEAKSLNRPDEVQLKILASNNLIGRIIGKGGNTIKRIMQESDTKIAVSSANFAPQLNLERIITISGQLENMCKAEVMISQKLRHCFESDCIHYQQSLIYSGYHSQMPPPQMLTSGHHHPHHQGPLNISGYGSQAATMPYSMGAPSTAALSPTMSGRSGQVNPASTSASAAGGSGSQQSSHQIYSVPPMSGQGGPSAPPPPPPGYYGAYNLPFMYPPGPSGSNIPALFSTGPGAWNLPTNYPYPMMATVESSKETVYVFIPNSVVGAIIGRGGSTIRDMMSNSGAIIKVAQLNEEESSSASSPTGDSSSAGSAGSTAGGLKQFERKVTIIGTAYAQYQAQCFVFSKVTSELCNQAIATGTTPSGLYGDPMVLKVEISVPTSHVRRIIGKNGSVIQELQRTTGATIKLSKETTTAATISGGGGGGSASGSETPENGSEEKALAVPTGPTPTTTTAATSESDMTLVHIIGDMHASFSAQRQIRSIVLRSSGNVPSSSSFPIPPSSSAPTAKSSSGGSKTEAASLPPTTTKSSEREITTKTAAMTLSTPPPPTNTALSSTTSTSKDVATTTTTTATTVSKSSSSSSSSSQSAIS